MRGCFSEILLCEVPDTSWEVANLFFPIGGLVLRSTTIEHCSLLGKLGRLFPHGAVEAPSGLWDNDNGLQRPFTGAPLGSSGDVQGAVFRCWIRRSILGRFATWRTTQAERIGWYRAFLASRSTDGNFGLPRKSKIVFRAGCVATFVSGFSGVIAFPWWVGCISHVSQQCSTPVALQLPPSLHECRCGMPLYSRGHQPVLESAAARVCREAGARVSLDVSGQSQAGDCRRWLPFILCVQCRQSCGCLGSDGAIQTTSDVIGEARGTCWFCLCTDPVLASSVLPRKKKWLRKVKMGCRQQCRRSQAIVVWKLCGQQIVVFPWVPANWTAREKDPIIF